MCASRGSVKYQNAVRTLTPAVSFLAVFGHDAVPFSLCASVLWATVVGGHGCREDAPGSTDQRCSLLHSRRMMELFSFSHPPPSHSLMHGSYVQPGGAAVLLFSWEGEATAQACGGEEDEEEEDEMGRASPCRELEKSAASQGVRSGCCASHPVSSR